MHCSKGFIACIFLVTVGSASLCFARPAESSSSASKDEGEIEAPQISDAELDRIDKRALLSRLNELEKRLAAVESTMRLQNGPVVPPPQPAAPTQITENVAPSPPAPPSAQSNTGLAQGTTLNVLFDGYYGYNFNRPIGRVNLLRAYDVSSNAFSLNQTGVILDHLPDPDHGRRIGYRVDLQYGQATQTLQGNAVNEPRPEIYRTIFQAYGTYVIPIGKGLNVDFGKFASSLGIEGNYTKDQMNYSRSFWFNYLPFYHLGIRANYKFNDKFTLNYWTVNGTQQSEPFNSFKDQFFGLTLQPAKSITWNVNYYLGQENPDVIYYPNGGAPPNSPTFQGVPFQPIRSAPTGKLHIFDSYVTWQANSKLAFALEGDYVVQRVEANAAPSHVSGGAVYVKYQFRPKIAFAGRGEYLTDRGGLFSGKTQALKENTFTAEYLFSEGFLMRAEYRRDFSNQPYFYTDVLGVLKKEQNTATLGLVWWFGKKQGAW